ncbi:hypothetical protein SCYAM73S_05698 [Streptomyces cyaneofuscatus]
MGEGEQERLRRTVAELSRPAAVISAVHGRIDPELFFDPAMRPDGEEKTRQLTFEDLLREEEGDDHDDHAGHLHAAYESVDFTSDVPLDPRRFIAFLDSRPEGLYRIKGFTEHSARGTGTTGTHCTRSAGSCASYRSRGRGGNSGSPNSS